jgi:hypothetical protein
MKLPGQRAEALRHLREDIGFSFRSKREVVSLKRIDNDDLLIKYWILLSFNLSQSDMDILQVLKRLYAESILVDPFSM